MIDIYFCYDIISTKDTEQHNKKKLEQICHTN